MTCDCVTSAFGVNSALSGFFRVSGMLKQIVLKQRNNSQNSKISRSVPSIHVHATTNDNLEAGTWDY